MVLIDTCIWIDHLRMREETVSQLLFNEQVLMHPFVAGEIALGTLKDRKNILRMFTELPQVKVASPEEVSRLIEQHGLFGIGIGYVDAHILAALRLTPYGRLMTRDKRLDAAARRLGIPQVAKLH